MQVVVSLLAATSSSGACSRSAAKRTHVLWLTNEFEVYCLQHHNTVNNHHKPLPSSNFDNYCKVHVHKKVINYL